jgi:hypothetical protein
MNGNKSQWTFSPERFGLRQLAVIAATATAVSLAAGCGSSGGATGPGPNSSLAAPAAAQQAPAARAGGPPGTVTASAGQRPGEQLVACSQLCIGGEGDERFSFGPVYEFVIKVPSGQYVSATSTQQVLARQVTFRVANFHVWFTGGDGTVALDSPSFGLYDSAGDGAPLDLGNLPGTQCLQSTTPGYQAEPNLIGTTLSLPKDPCFGFLTNGPVTPAALNFVNAVNLTR